MRPSPLLPPWAAAQTDANLSTHLHRLPTPPTYLRRMRLLHGRGAGVGWQIMLLVVRGTVPANHRAHESLSEAPLEHIGPRGGLNLSSPSALLKVNCLVISSLYFRSMRGDLQEGNCCASRCQFPLFLVPIPIFPSTKSGFLCAFGVRNPRFRAFRAQNRGFCAFLASGTLVFWLFEHKIGVFVLGQMGELRR